MSSTLHYDLKDAPSDLYKGERCHLLIQFVLYANERNRCWPVMDTLANRLGKSKTSLSEAKQWLVKVGAIEVVEYAHRVGKEKSLPQRQCVYQLTGRLCINGDEYPYLYLDTERNGHIERTDGVRTKRTNGVRSEKVKRTASIRTDGVRKVYPSKDTPLNTDISNEISMRSDHIAEPVNMVGDTIPTENRQHDSHTDAVLVEVYEEPQPPTAPPPPSPTVVHVNKDNTTIVENRDPLFDSIAKLQFGIADTSNMPVKITKTGKKQSAYGGVIGKLEKIIVDGYKAIKRIDKLSPDEFAYLASQHSKFWTWWQTVKYPPTNGNKPLDLRSAEKFDVYWDEYRQWVIDQNAAARKKPKQHDPHCPKCHGYGTVYYISPRHDPDNKRIRQQSEPIPAGWYETSDDCDCEVAS